MSLHENKTSPATGPTSELVLRWPLCQTEGVLYRLALKFCMSLVHSDSASSSRSSGLCRCLLWDNACGNLYFGLLISVAADAYRFDLRKFIKGPALSACSVVQSSPSCEGSPFHWVPHSQGMMDAFFSAFGYLGGVSLPGQPEKLWTWCTELRIAHFLGLTLGIVAWEQGQAVNSDLSETGLILNCWTLSLGCWQLPLLVVWS